MNILFIQVSKKVDTICFLDSSGTESSKEPAEAKNVAECNNNIFLKGVNRVASLKQTLLLVYHRETKNQAVQQCAQ